MWKNKDVPLLLGLLACIAASFFLLRPQAVVERVAQIRVYLDGDLYCQQPLCEGEELLISQPDGSENRLTLSSNGFQMTSSTCQNQLCVQQGRVTTANYTTRSLGTHIICLPNRIDAELVVPDAPIDPALPDV